MKILLVHNFYQLYGGEDAVFNQEKQLLRRHGNKVHTFTISNDDIKGTYAKIKAGLGVVYSKSVKKALKEKLRQCNPDIVHVHNFFPLLTSSVYDACLELGIPLVHTLHNFRLFCPSGLLFRNDAVCELCLHGCVFSGIRYRCYRGSLLGSSLVALMDYCYNKQAWYKKVTTFIVLSQFSKSKFVEAGFDPDTIVVKPNFCTSDNSIDPIKTDGDVSSGKQKYALFVGRLSREKGIHTLIRSWENLGFALRVLGKGPLYEKMKVRKSKTVTLLGHVTPEQVIKQMQEAEFLIVPSGCYENFPMTILEAFASSIPVIASDIGSLSEIVVHKQTGLLFESGNSYDLARKAAWLFNNKEEKRRMGNNARRLYEQSYTPDSNYRLLMQIYENALKI